MRPSTGRTAEYGSDGRVRVGRPSTGRTAEYGSDGRVRVGRPSTDRTAEYGSDGRVRVGRPSTGRTAASQQQYVDNQLLVKFLFPEWSHHCLFMGIWSKCWWPDALPDANPVRIRKERLWVGNLFSGRCKSPPPYLLMMLTRGLEFWD